MAEFVKLTTFRGEDLYVNVDLIRAVLKGGAVGVKGPHSSVQFDNEHAYLVQGDPVDVMEIIWPARKQYLKQPKP